MSYPVPMNNMIIIRIHKKIKSFHQHSYNKFVKSINFDDLEWSLCHNCSWHFHAYYNRHVDFFYRKHTIRIVRIQCNCCHITHAILIQDIIPYSITDYDLIVDFINDHDTYSSSHVAFLKSKYPLSINDYECVCLMNSRNHPCIFYHTT